MNPSQYYQPLSAALHAPVVAVANNQAHLEYPDYGSHGRDAASGGTQHREEEEEEEEEDEDVVEEELEHRDPHHSPSGHSSPRPPQRPAQASSSFTGYVTFLSRTFSLSTLARVLGPEVLPSPTNSTPSHPRTRPASLQTQRARNASREDPEVQETANPEQLRALLLHKLPKPQ